MKDKKNAAEAVKAENAAQAEEIKAAAEDAGKTGKMKHSGSRAFFLFPGGRQRKKIKNRSGRRNFRAVRGVIRV